LCAGLQASEATQLQASDIDSARNVLWVRCDLVHAAQIEFDIALAAIGAT
jgi:hypothetical protein